MANSDPGGNLGGGPGSTSRFLLNEFALARPQKKHISTWAAEARRRDGSLRSVCDMLAIYNNGYLKEAAKARGRREAEVGWRQREYSTFLIISDDETTWNEKGWTRSLSFDRKSADKIRTENALSLVRFCRHVMVDHLQLRPERLFQLASPTLIGILSGSH